MKLKISDAIALPVDWMTMATVAYGARGSGKTTFACVVAEEVHKAKQRFCIIDLKGDTYGLKSSADGRHEAIPVVIFGGDHADLPLEENAGAFVGETIAGLEQSTIIDLEHFSKGKQIRFLSAFFSALYDKNREPLLLLLDEAQRYAPQRPMNPEGQVCLGAVEDLVKLGRKHGIGVFLATQRGSGLNKEVSEICDMLVAFRTPGPLDQDRVRDWLEANCTKAQRDEVLGLLAGLDTGTAVFASGHPALKLFKVAEVRARETYDSSATPKIGQRRREPRKLATPDLILLREKMAATIERARQDDPKELKKRIAVLEREVLDLERELKMEQARPTQVTAKIKEIKVPLLDVAVLKRVEKLRADLDGVASKVTAAVLEFRDSIARAQQEIVAEWRPPAPVELGDAVETYTRRVEHGSQLRAATKEAVAKSTRAGISAPMVRILNSLAWWLGAGIERPTRHQVAFGAKYTVNGHFNNVVGEMNSLGLLSFPEPGKLALTESGTQHCGQIDSRPPSAQRLADKVLEVLREEPQRRVFRAILEAPGSGLRPVSRAYLAEKAGYTVNGHFNNVVGSLHGIGVFKYPEKGMVALGDMFDIASLAGAGRRGT